MTGTPASVVEAALGVSASRRMTLESIPAERWTVGQMATYLAACGYSLQVTATDRIDGAVHVVELGQ